MNTVQVEEIESDVLVVGGGIAGMFAALKAQENGASVTLAVKGAVNRSGCTPFAFGFVVFDERAGHDRQQWHDIVALNGEYLNNRKSLDALMDDSLARYEELDAWGVTKKRSVFRNVVQKSDVNVVERVMVTDLITNQGGQVIGAVGFPFDQDKLLVFKARAVVLATGAGAFKPTGFPISSLTSDGEAMAFRAGAEITGKEFNDTHFTGALYPANGMYYPEKTFMRATSPHPLEFLTIDREIQAHQGEIPVFAPRMGPPPGSPMRKGPPPGGPPGKRPSQPPIKPDLSQGVVGSATAGLGVHKSEGIWPVDDHYATSVPGLYAAGDVCGSMLCGAKYGGVGFSVSYSSVQGARAGKAAAEYALKTERPVISKGVIDKLKKSVFEPRARQKGYKPEWVTQALQNYMTPYFVLYVKKQDRLEAALVNIEYLRDHFAPNLLAQSTHELRLAHETRNMLLNAEIKLRASLFRTESRGVHYREDYPARDDENWLAWILIKNNNGKIKLSKEPVPQKWRPDSSLSYEERYPNRFPGELAFSKRVKK